MRFYDPSSKTTAYDELKALRAEVSETMREVDSVYESIRSAIGSDSKTTVGLQFPHFAFK